MKKTAIIIIGILFCGFAAKSSAIEEPNRQVSPSAEQTTQDSKAVTQLNTPKVEVVFVLDTTGSMGGLINAAKEKIWSIANTLATSKPSPEIKIGLIGYRDRGDEYVTRVHNLTDDLDLIYSKLLDFKANGGGDSPESVNQALNEAVAKMNWGKDKNIFKVIYLVGDCPPHMDYQDDVKYSETCKIAAEQGIFINTIQCGTQSETTPIWKDIALKAEGMDFRVEQSGSAILASTPFDSELAKLSASLDDTRIFYGSKAELEAQENRALNSDKIYKDASLAAQASRVAFNAGGRGGAAASNFTGKKELVNDIENGRVQLSEMKADELDEKMKGMTPEQQKEYIEKMSAKRKDIQKQIQDLSGKRQQYIKEQVKTNNLDNKQTLDSALFQSIQQQASKRNIIYSDGPVY
jgi:Mg-chelatase subunit ChlD